MKTFLFLLLAVACFPVSAQKPALADPRPDWAIGVAAFEGRDLSPENVYLTRSFPLLLRERLEAIPEHYFSEAEVRAYREHIIQEERKRLVKAVGADRRARDELFFTSDSPAREAAVYEQRIAANLQAIRELQDFDPEQIAFPQSKPLRFVSGADGQLVFDREVLSPFQLAKQQDLDVLLWGRFEEVQGFIYFEISLFSAALGEPLFTYSDAVAPVELYELSEELIAELATVLWGRDWSSLTVQTVPEGASVWIDQVFQGRTPLSIPYLLPGGKEMRLHLPGHRSELRWIELSPYVEELQQITLVPEQREPFTLDSDPQGAAVYRGSEWLGTTPLSVEKPEELSRFLLRREGYLDFPLYAYPTLEQTITADLLPDQLDPGEIQNRRRDELYRAFGAFALSLPFPIFAADYWTNYTVRATDLRFQGKDAEAAAAQDTADLLSYVYFATFGVSSGLFVNLMVRLIRYLKAADRKA
jgi:hypothetical protein